MDLLPHHRQAHNSIRVKKKVAEKKEQQSFTVTKAPYAVLLSAHRGMDIVLVDNRPLFRTSHATADVNDSRALD